jgi:hypothetical protein
MKVGSAKNVVQGIGTTFVVARDVVPASQQECSASKNVVQGIGTTVLVARKASPELHLGMTCTPKAAKVVILAGRGKVGTGGRTAV